MTKIKAFLSSLFAPRIITIERYHSKRMTAAQRQAWDSAFDALDKAHRELDKVFRGK